LESLFLSTNLFSGDPAPVWNEMRQLKLLLADFNEFTSELDDSFLRHNTRLAWLDLSNNDFTLHGRTNKMSTIPWHFFSMSK
jgi:hypothetical protein